MNERDKGALGREKLSELFHRGRQRAAESLQELQASRPRDAVVPGAILNFTDNGDGHFGARAGDLEFTGLHNHALRQVCQRGPVQLPAKYVDALSAQGQWGRDLLVHTLNENYAHDQKRYLTRSVGGEMRGFLSDRYRRIDNAPIVESFIRKVVGHGGVPVEARCLDTKFFLKVLLDKIYEPVPGEVMAFGITLHNSDYGDGSYWLRAFMLRLVCLNGMLGEDVLRQVHLGKRLSDDVAFSQQTYELDTRALVSATDDLVDHVLEPRQIEGRMDKIKAAAEAEIDPRQKVAAMVKGAKLTKSEAQQISDLYNGPDVELLPPGNTDWRLSNAIGLFAHQEGVNPARGLELERLAGEMV